MIQLTPEEFIKKRCIDDGASELIASLLDQLEENKGRFEQYDRSIELANEQVYFARELVENITRVLKTETKAKQMKTSIEGLLRDTLFEW